MRHARETTVKELFLAKTFWLIEKNEILVLRVLNFIQNHAFLANLENLTYEIYILIYRFISFGLWDALIKSWEDSKLHSSFLFEWLGIGLTLGCMCETKR